VRLQKALGALSRMKHAAMREAAQHHSRLALARVERAMVLPDDIEIVRTLSQQIS